MFDSFLLVIKTLLQILLLIEFLILIVFSIRLSRNVTLFFRNLNHNLLLKRFDVNSVILSESMERAFEKVRLDDLLVHYQSGYKLKQEDIKKYGAKFVELVKEYTGPNIIKDWVKLKGSEESFYSFLLNDFFRRCIKEEQIMIQKRLDQAQQSSKRIYE